MRICPRARVLAAVLWMAAVAPAVRAQREPPVPKELQERFGEWAELYLAQAPEFAAKETRSETARGKRATENVQVAVARYTLRRTGRIEWVESRTPLEGGEKSPRLEGALNQLPERAAGPLTLVSRLATRYHERMKYFFAQDTSDTVHDLVLVGYRQIDGEGLIDVEGKGVAPTGVAWIDPEDGHVTRIEEQFIYKGTRYTTAVEFVRDDVLGAWVPREVTVRVFEKGRMAAQRIYTYEDFQRLRPEDRAGQGAPANKP